MSYHRGGQAGAVAVSYSTSPMAPHSPSRRCSTGSSGTSGSTIGTSTSKLSTYRSAGSSSILDRPANFYSSSSSSGSSGYRSNYTSEYRRPYCPSGRSVSSSAYSGTGSSGAGSTNVTANGTSSSGGRYGLSASSSSSSISLSSRDRGQESSSSRQLEPSTTTAADIISWYSPSGYVPNIRQATGGGGHQWRHHSTGSSLTELFGGDEREVDRTRDRPESSLSSTSSSSLSSSAAVSGALWSRSKRRPLSSSTVLTSGHVRAESAASPGEVTIDERGTARDLDENEDDDDADDANDENDGNTDDENDGNDDNTDDDQHNNNSNGNSCSAEDACGYGINNNDDADVDADGDADSDDSDDNLNNRHHHQQRAAHRTDEVSPAKRNLLSPVVPGGAGGASLIGVKLDLLTNLATNPSNTELLINNNDQDELSRSEEDVELEDTSSDEVIRGINEAIAFLQGGRAGDQEILEDGEKEQRNGSGSYDIDQTGYGGGGTSPVLQNGVAGRPSGTYGDDPSAPSTSRRSDGHFSGSTNAAGNLTSSSPTAPSTAHQSLYRAVADQFEGSPTNKAARNRLQAHRDERCGLNGLRNIGNTCFMNSVIQCLSNTRPLLEYLLNEQYLADINTTTSSMKGALIKAFSQVIHELWEVGGDHVVNTTALKSQIQRFAPRFMGYSQQDAQEFLRYLLEGLHEDVNRVTVKPQPIHTDIPEMYTDSQKAVESWKRYLRSEDSMIVDVFVGQLRSSLHCTACDHVSVTLDPVWDLSLPIPARSGTVKLSQCLEHFTREEVLDGDEKPTCSKCQMRRKCTKSFSIQKFPKILVIHLKRFSPMERFRGKLSVMVDFPLTGLDLSAFAAPRVPGCTYNLYGVANHSGTTYSGHYTAYCKHPYSGEWHEYNDSRVSVVPARSVVSSEAYVLFYEQQPHSSHL
ncbi:uncharacterized protein LOC143377259 isoform X2 [Andrena cerasifolii]|uniref:uncharacterized protein LOC143377259 isoform X2 n=1 Tax=Andrena cerasifolii TaxID=2819439 RepID=UPI004037638C